MTTPKTPDSAFDEWLNKFYSNESSFSTTYVMQLERAFKAGIDCERDRASKLVEALEFYGFRKHLKLNKEVIGKTQINWDSPAGYIGSPYIHGSEMGQIARQALKDAEPKDE